MVRVANYDKGIIAATARCCDALGIRWNVTVTAATGNQTQDCIHLYIADKGSFEIIQREVPLQSARKRENLDRLVASYVQAARREKSAGRVAAWATLNAA
jgi:hypothetical protein